MKAINYSTNQIILYVSDHDSVSKKTIAYGTQHGLPISIIDLQKVPFTGTHLLSLSQMLGVKLDSLANLNSAIFSDTIGEGSEFETEDWIKLYKRHPQLLKTPIAVKGTKAMLIHTPSDILQL